MRKSLWAMLFFLCSPAFAGIKSATIVSEPTNKGQKITQVLLEYDEWLSSAYVPNVSVFAIKDRQIRAISLGNCIEPSQTCHSHQLILHLSPDDPAAGMIFQVASREPAQERSPEYAIKQVEPIKLFASPQAVSFDEILPNTFYTNKLNNAVADDFVQGEFKDESGVQLKYNLFVPADYDPQKRYPLVIFLHDASAVNPNVRNTLWQGNGATVWASPEFQQMHAAFVLAPQFDSNIINDNVSDSAYLEPTINLIKSLVAQYPIDENRLYATGQAEGAMITMAMNIKYPKFFAASYIVAGAWAADKTAPMARTKQFILVSEDDTKAFVAQNAISEVLALNGALVQKARLSGTTEAVQIEQEVQDLLVRMGNVYLMIVKSQTLPAQLNEPNTKHPAQLAHTGTSQIAYDIPAIQQWLFEQHKE